MDYVQELLLYFGRTRASRYDEWSQRHPVLPEIMEWLGEQLNDPFSRLFDWRNFDIDNLQRRIAEDRDARPRIEIAAWVTSKENLTVRWYPLGWHSAPLDFRNSEHFGYFNLVAQRQWPSPPDFRWVTGDEESTFQSRASNELMFIRGVGDLDPRPEGERGPYSAPHSGIIDGILIAAVRSLYEGLLKGLERNFEVTALNAFDFRIVEEIHGDDEWERRSPVRRIASWTLENADELQKRREEENRILLREQGKKEIDSTEQRYGFTVEQFRQTMKDAGLKKPTGPSPSAAGINRSVSNLLRKQGFKITEGGVKRLAGLLNQLDGL